MRSRHFQLMGEVGKSMARAYLEADVENREAIKEAAFEAMVHCLVEHHGFTRDEILASHSQAVAEAYSNSSSSPDETTAHTGENEGREK